MSNTRVNVLVPIDVLGGEMIPESVIELLSGMDVTLLGYHVLPEQTATEQAHDQFHEKVAAELAEYEARFESHGGTVQSRSVFTHDKADTIERVAVEERTGTVLLLNPAPTIERVLVPIRGAVNVDRLAGVTAALAATAGLEIRLFHVTDEDGAEAGETLLADARQGFVDAGVNEERLTTEVTVAEQPIEALKSAADTTDFVIMGEHEPSILDIILGEASTKVADSSLSPVLVVRTGKHKNTESE